MFASLDVTSRIQVLKEGIWSMENSTFTSNQNSADQQWDLGKGWLGVFSMRSKDTNIRFFIGQTLERSKTTKN